MIRRAGENKNTKRLVIKSLSNAPKLPENFNANTWAKLSNAIQAIHDAKPVSDSMESLYNSVKDLCLHKLAEETYKKLREQYKQYLTKKGKLLQDTLRQGDEITSILHQTNDIWNTHCQQIRMIRDIFLYLDRTYVYQTKEHSIWEMGCVIFRSEVMEDQQIVQKIIQGLLNLIENERNNQTIERSLLQNLLRMLIALDMYQVAFENEFLESTSTYYHDEGKRKLEENLVPYYLHHIENRLKEETERAKTYLSHSTTPKLRFIVEKELIKEHSCDILDKGFFSLMEENNKNDLALLYYFLKQVNSLQDLESFLSSFVKVIIFLP